MGTVIRVRKLSYMAGNIQNFFENQEKHNAEAKKPRAIP